MTRTYFEYNRGTSFPLYSDLSLNYGNHDFKFHNIYFDDYSFFPDDSIIPNAFLKPLFRGKFSEALKAFTEPYYGYRLIHFLKKYPRIGIGVEFIHHKIFLDDKNQTVKISGTYDGAPVNKDILIGDYIDYFSVSHGINHLSLTLFYRWMLKQTPRIPDGKLQPFIMFSAGPTFPHLELKLTENPSQWAAFSYNSGSGNYGLGTGLGIRYKPWKHFGFYLEYKLTYSHLHCMSFDDGKGEVNMSFISHHIQWGISLML
jgi:hypothetical protein